MLNDLYQEIILDHSKRPRNCQSLEDAQRKAEGYNPLCGDKFKLFLKITKTAWSKDVSFQGSGCAISTASASLMTEMLEGQDRRKQAEALLEKFHELLTKTPSLQPRIWASWWCSRACASFRRV